MNKIILLVALGIMTMMTLDAKTHFRRHRVNIRPLSITRFELTDANFKNPHIVDLKNKDFFVVSVREPGSDGEAYAVDRDGTIWWHGRISSGAGGGKLVGNKVIGGHETNNNIFHVLAKRRYHMSSTHPSSNGKNNMDFEIQFTRSGEALHLGNINAMSHGCVHVSRQDIAPLFHWARIGMPVVIMRGHYRQFLEKQYNEFQNTMKSFDSYKSLRNIK